MDLSRDLSRFDYPVVLRGHGCILDCRRVDAEHPVPPSDLFPGIEGQIQERLPGVEYLVQTAAGETRWVPGWRAGKGPFY